MNEKSKFDQHVDIKYHRCTLDNFYELKEDLKEERRSGNSFALVSLAGGLFLGATIALIVSLPYDDITQIYAKKKKDIATTINLIKEYSQKNKDVRNLETFTSDERPNMPQLSTAQQLEPADITGDRVKDSIIVDVPTGTAWYANGTQEPSFISGLRYHKIEPGNIRKTLDQHIKDTLRYKNW